MDKSKLMEYIGVLKKQFPQYTYEISDKTGESIITVSPVSDEEMDVVMDFVDQQIVLPAGQRNEEIPVILTLPVEMDPDEDLAEDLFEDF